MKNDTKTIITIEMNNVDHAHNLVKALETFFKISDAGGDSELHYYDGYSHDEKCGFIGHDVRKPKISLSYKDKVGIGTKPCPHWGGSGGF